jgi:hypothetical protein
VGGEEVTETGEETGRGAVGVGVGMWLRLVVPQLAVVMAVGRAMIMGVAVVVAVALLVVPVAHGGPLPVRGSGRVGVHKAIMCV